jgi:hypothetical protein
VTINHSKPLWLASLLVVFLHIAFLALWSANLRPKQPLLLLPAVSARFVAFTLKKTSLAETIQTKPKSFETPRSTTVSVNSALKSALVELKSAEPSSTNIERFETKSTTSSTTTFFNLSPRVKYFQRDEVDEPAAPAENPKILTNNLPQEKIIFVRLAVYISSTGTVDNFELLSTSTDSSDIAQALAIFNSTIFTPAKKNEVPVASVLDIELGIDTRANAAFVPN